MGPFRLSILLLALGCSAAEEPIQKLQYGIRNRAGRLAAKRAKFEDPPETDPPAEEPPTCDVCPINKIKDSTRREGLGESPGIPNLEYLGLGYNIFEGNPRGSDISEADPGFRSGVIKLIQKQTELTIDQEYMVPLGVDVRYITACKFASKATELSSERQYQSEISREASQSTEVSAGASAGLFSVSAEYSFSQSSKYKEFTENTRETQAVTFEARALCSEFKAALKPYYSHSKHETFERALSSLSIPWTNSPEQREEYLDFLSSFGTHYVSDVTLGAKHIFSSIISSEDVTELTRQEVDIESSLSWSVQASFGSGGQGNDAYGVLPRSKAEFAIPGGIGMVETTSYIFEESSIGGGTSNTETLSEEKKNSNLERVKSKVSTVNELNVGGNPPEDGNWKTWATSVRDRPMPISYELTGIWNMMANETYVKAFQDAIIDLYNIDLRKRKDSTIIDALRFGVTRGDGRAISSYNRDPSSNYRSNLQLNAIPGGFFKKEITGNIVESPTGQDGLDADDECDNTPSWTGFLRPQSDTELFACGMQAKEDAADIGITGLKVTYCSVDDWANSAVQKTVNMRNVGSDEGIAVFCDPFQFIVGVRVKVDETTGDNQGMDGLWITCANIPLNSDTEPITIEKEVYNDASFGSGETYWSSERSESNLFMSSTRVLSCTGLGIYGMELEYSQQLQGGRRYATYEYDVSREGDEVTAIFASTVRGSVGENIQEDMGELGFVVPDPIFTNVFNVESYYPFGIFERSTPKIVIQNFKDKSVNSEELQSFSFLSGKNLPAQADYIAGVVHPDGYPLNEIFSDDDIGFRVSQLSRREFYIRFPGGENQMTDPTFIVFPLWIPGSANQFPSKIGEVVAATRSCDETGCYVVTGASDNPSAKNYLGFSFIALRGGLNTGVVSGIAHGVVTVKDNGNQQPPSIIGVPEDYNGFTAEPSFAGSPDTFTVRAGDRNSGTIDFTEYAGGILITFETPFRGLPAVIVSPIIGNRNLGSSSTDEVSLPYAVVEHISEEKAFVKVNWVDTTGADPSKDAEAISFHILVVGPQRDPYLNGARII